MKKNKTFTSRKISFYICIYYARKALRPTVSRLKIYSRRERLWWIYPGGERHICSSYSQWEPDINPHSRKPSQGYIPSSLPYLSAAGETDKKIKCEEGGDKALPVATDDWKLVTQGCDHCLRPAELWETRRGVSIVNWFMLVLYIFLFILCSIL